jgi:hypothetical protein
MTSPNQVKGARAEETVARFLREHGFPSAERIRVKHPDRGDIGGLTDWTIEVKNIGKLTLANAVDQMCRARVTTATPWGVAVLQRRNHSAGRWFAVAELGQWVATARLLDETGPCERCGGGAA